MPRAAVGQAVAQSADEPTSVIEALQVPGAGDPVEVDEGQPAGADRLEVVAGDGAAPPGVLDAPAGADLHGLAAAAPK